MAASSMKPTTSRYPSAEALMADATETTGLTDFGPGDFREGLDVLLESLARDADLSPATDASVVDDLHRRLVNRLEVEAWYRDHPELSELPVRGPIDINGLPRTGTTALANMMSLDPQFRCLRQWEQMQPCPPPTTEGEATDPRRLQLARENEQLSPELKAMHLYEVDATVEDTWLLGMAFHGQQYTVPVYGYHAWWRTADLTPTFRYHRRVVTLLQSQRPPDLWLFKAPHHNFDLEAIVAAYPDARFVMTHRDPAKSVPSWASIVSTIFPESQAPRDLHRVGREVSEHLRVGVEHAIAARVAPRGGPFPRRPPPRPDRRPDGHGACGLRIPRTRAAPAGRAGVARLAGGQPVRRTRDTPLHGRAVRPQHGPTALRLRLLRPSLRRRARSLTDRRATNPPDCHRIREETSR